ncbi:hypothetical protein PMAC_001900 [Pneumocystis sp. 'macacae']|nr:hypothetical protein PMAC_001900 [Pneumocystis sp. 'macacae']
MRLLTCILACLWVCAAAPNTPPTHGGIGVDRVASPVGVYTETLRTVTLLTTIADTVHTFTSVYTQTFSEQTQARPVLSGSIGLNSLYSQTQIDSGCTWIGRKCLQSAATRLVLAFVSVLHVFVCYLPLFVYNILSTVSCDSTHFYLRCRYLATPFIKKLYTLNSGTRDAVAKLGKIFRYFVQMGCTFSCAYDPETLRSREIEAYLRRDEDHVSVENAQEVKVLLLGCRRWREWQDNDSQGMWYLGLRRVIYVFQQMRLIHMSGFTQEEREYYRTIVFSNMLQSMRLIIEAMEEFDICFDRPENEVVWWYWYSGLIWRAAIFGFVIAGPGDYKPGESAAGVLPAAYFVVGRCRGDLCISRNGSISIGLRGSFFENIHRLFDRKYIPTDQDILRCRLKTTGITETCFKVSGLMYRMIDVGGQRSERRKWIHCFENVTAVLFLVAISGYDQCLTEDNGANQMQEALVLFDSICNSQWFINTSIILFLNKIDLFKVKLHVSLISNYFPDFNSDNQNDYRASCLFFRQKFLKLNRNHQKTIYTHFTNATDTTLLKNVMVSVSDIIFNQNLQNLML